jgi:hypothetical protein
MRSAIVLPIVLVALLIAGCGGGDDSTSSTVAGPTGATGGQGSAGGTGMTAKEFIDASIPDEVAAVQEAADANPACAGTNTDAGSDFQVTIAIEVAKADPDTPISEMVADHC